MTSLARNPQVQASVQTAVQALRPHSQSEHSLTSKISFENSNANQDGLTVTSASGPEPLLSAGGPLQSEASRARRQALSESFNRAAQTLDEATLNAERMVAGLERQKHLLKAPSKD